MKEDIHDLIGVGIGPFNLGLAALIDGTEDVEAIFFEQELEFDWHPGMMLEKMNLQVPFLADLVTFADPTSPYTYLNYLHHQNRLFPFFFHSEFKAPRQEYNDYLQWVAERLNGLYFGHEVVDLIDHDGEDHPYYEVVVKKRTTGETLSWFSRHVVIGTGSDPLLINGMERLPNEDVLHTSRYLFERENLLKAKHVTVVGSGQSAAEVFLDLLKEQERQDMHLSLLTRSGGLFQIDTAKFAQEFFTPDYVDYFYSLDYTQRKDTLDILDPLRKGIDPDTLKELYDTLYHKSVGHKETNVRIQPMIDVEDITARNGKYILTCHQWQEGKRFDYETDKVVLGTGYHPHIPQWLIDRFGDQVEWEGEGDLKVSRDYRLVFQDNRDHHVFMLTDLVHSHGAGATNLGLSVNRNVHIVNSIAGREVYENQRQNAFQQFSAKDEHE
ncbi:lysine N(6)-hydroxylase/L-ornithine N(5)-oxygenase family protein [Thalassobacillus sp. CUG 92003]|uniref:lysine N(6)-hydroxylase/L-ornithine N(5)-oxygenase family protein n=1 Tax=Thalassobacillus sp. CUG 92003 TaxID=2736641 RepID=UPI0015E6FD2A|nr:SidA/IucD/PvdA family monooxygenase [Thalassobacillus sp. CUG 92003]